MSDVTADLQKLLAESISFVCFVCFGLPCGILTINHASKGASQCRDTPRLEGIELEQALRTLPAWQLDENRQSLTRQFTAKNFVAGRL